MSLWCSSRIPMKFRNCSAKSSQCACHCQRIQRVLVMCDSALKKTDIGWQHVGWQIPCASEHIWNMLLGLSSAVCNRWFVPSADYSPLPFVMWFALALCGACMRLHMERLGQACMSSCGNLWCMLGDYGKHGSYIWIAGHELTCHGGHISATLCRSWKLMRRHPWVRIQDTWKNNDSHSQSPDLVRFISYLREII